MRSTSSINATGHHHQTAVGPGWKSHVRLREAGTSPGQRRRVTAQNDRPGEGRAKGASNSAGTITLIIYGAVDTRKFTLLFVFNSTGCVRTYARPPK